MGVNRVDYAGDTLIDISQDTVTSEDMAEGISAHGADGEPVIGVAKKTWTGTQEQYELEKNSIVAGTIVNITNDYSEKGGSSDKLVTLTQAQYDALGDVTATDNVYYFIIEE